MNATVSVVHVSLSAHTCNREEWTIVESRISWGGAVGGNTVWILPEQYLTMTYFLSNACGTESDWNVTTKQTRNVKICFFFSMQACRCSMDAPSSLLVCRASPSQRPSLCVEFITVFIWPWFHAWVFAENIFFCQFSQTTEPDSMPNVTALPFSKKGHFLPRGSFKEVPFGLLPCSVLF